MKRYWGDAATFISEDMAGIYSSVLLKRMSTKDIIEWNSVDFCKGIEIHDLCLSQYRVRAVNQIDYFIRTSNIKKIDFFNVNFDTSTIPGIVSAIADVCDAVSLREISKSQSMKQLLKTLLRARNLTASLRLLNANKDTILFGIPMRQFRISKLDLGSIEFIRRREVNLFMSSVSQSSLEELSLSRILLNVHHGKSRATVEASQAQALNVSKIIFIYELPKSLVKVRLAGVKFNITKVFLRRLITQRAKLDEAKVPLFGSEAYAFDEFKFRCIKRHCKIDCENRTKTFTSDNKSLVF